MDFLKNNAWSLIIAAITMVSTFTLYGYRIDALEKIVDENRTAIVELNTQQNTINIQLAQIATDIQYIKVNVDRLFGRGSSQYQQ